MCNLSTHQNTTISNHRITVNSQLDQDNYLIRNHKSVMHTPVMLRYLTTLTNGNMNTWIHSWQEKVTFLRPTSYQTSNQNSRRTLTYCDLHLPKLLEKKLWITNTSKKNICSQPNTRLHPCWMHHSSNAETRPKRFLF